MWLASTLHALCLSLDLLLQSTQGFHLPQGPKTYGQMQIIPSQGNTDALIGNSVGQVSLTAHKPLPAFGLRADLTVGIGGARPLTPDT
jgi:hypothetical protein